MVFTAAGGDSIRPEKPFGVVMRPMLTMPPRAVVNLGFPPGHPIDLAAPEDEIERYAEIGQENDQQEPGDRARWRSWLTKQVGDKNDGEQKTQMSREFGEEPALGEFQPLKHS